MNLRRTLLLIGAIVLTICIHAQSASQAQEDTLHSPKLPSKYLDNISSKATSLEQKLDKKTTKALRQLQKQEDRIKNKLARKDSLKAAAVFGNAQQQYDQLEQKLSAKTSLQQYIPSLDTLNTSLKFLQQNPQLLSSGKDVQQKLQHATGKVQALQAQLQNAEEVKKFLKERRQYLKDQLVNLGFAKELKKINKQVYYYSAQVSEYKSLLKDRKRAEKKALELLSKTKLFQNFMRKNSMLASLFRLPGDPADPVSQQISFAGLQTRSQVSGMIQQQIAAGGPNAQQQLQQNLQGAQSQLNELKNKLNKMGSSSSEDILPDGFKPNNQKIKNFFQRIELGTNIQSQKANGYFPTTSDVGLSLGYKLNDKSIIGIGGSYKLGWGQNIRHINITHQGVGLRSFADWKIKGSFWLSGGYEMNYRSEFRNVDELKSLNAWQTSGLVGLSKVVSLKTKFFKKTKLQLLWDFLSYQQMPRTQRLKFRIGYTF
ncbi:hypothetical protein [Terrimonas pollutisoli]|uniref:hypothetical protein n=1 Tax=Terrimonas pollutisoli TaxID=3034147 RepID=UPI0023EC0D6E|nr:hypothetical protein [Terrimonas sp. H1YJ31]